MFGLSAALDTHTQDLLERKRHISGQDVLSEDDRKTLKEINEELRRLDQEEAIVEREELPDEAEKARRLVQNALKKREG